MSDFFAALELELHAAGRRRPRRGIAVGQALSLAAAAILLAVAVALTMTVRGGGESDSGEMTGAGKPDPVGTVIPKGEGTPPRVSRSLVVATGTSPGVGAWQMEVSRSTKLTDPKRGTVYQEAGLRCLSLFPVQSRRRTALAGGQCGEFPRTPGFSRLQVPTFVFRGDVDRARRLPVLVYGRAPERAASIVATGPGWRLETRPLEGPRGARGDFYAISVPRGRGAGRINWLDGEGRPGSRGIALLPPIANRP